MNYKRLHDAIIAHYQINSATGYIEKHHIVPKCMGGTNDKTNLVQLTARAHFLVHRLLCKIYPDNHKLRYAFHMMFVKRNIGGRQTDIGWVKTSSKNTPSIKSQCDQYKRVRFYQLTIKLKYLPEIGGKSRSAEFRAKVSSIHKGKIVSKETRARMSASQTGATKSIETRNKMSAAARRRPPMSIETRNKIKATLTGSRHIPHIH